MPVSLRIPPGTPNGRTFRVRGKGVRRQDSTYGDLLVTVDVRVPKDINGEAREALETLRKLAPAMNTGQGREVAGGRPHGRR
jgi:molecular chaperone DnaJ